MDAIAGSELQGVGVLRFFKIHFLFFLLAQLFVPSSKHRLTVCLRACVPACVCETKGVHAHGPDVSCERAR